MAKEKKELTTKQKLRRNKIWQKVCKVGELAVLPIPYVAMMIANRDTWFHTPDSGVWIGLGGISAIGLLVSTIWMVINETKKEDEYNPYVYIIIKYLMITLIITMVEHYLHSIAGVLWIATSGIAASFGIDLERRHLMKQDKEMSEMLKGAKVQLGTEKARQELLEEQEAKAEKKIKIKIKK